MSKITARNRDYLPTTNIKKSSTFTITKGITEHGPSTTCTFWFSLSLLLFKVFLICWTLNNSPKIVIIRSIIFYHDKGFQEFKCKIISKWKTSPPKCTFHWQRGILLVCYYWRRTFLMFWSKPRTNFQSPLVTTCASKFPSYLSLDIPKKYSKRWFINKQF